jgi:hypothetical protein
VDEERDERDNHPRVPNEVDPLDVKLPNDPAGVRTAQAKHVNLYDLRDVLEQMSRLGQHEEGEHC